MLTTIAVSWELRCLDDPICVYFSEFHIVRDNILYACVGLSDI